VFQEYGYYSKPLSLASGKKVPEGSKIIAMNTQVCDPLNFHLMAERSDAGGEFAWLEKELLEVEGQGGVAVLIGHFDPRDCDHQFGMRFRALNERF